MTLMVTDHSPQAQDLKEKSMLRPRPHERKKHAFFKEKCASFLKKNVHFKNVDEA
jgi:hypothetical protein